MPQGKWNYKSVYLDKSRDFETLANQTVILEVIFLMMYFMISQSLQCWGLTCDCPGMWHQVLFYIVNSRKWETTKKNTHKNERPQDVVLVACFQGWHRHSGAERMLFEDTVHGKLAQVTFIIKQKQRHHFPNKYLYSQAMVFPVVMYEWENWIIKKAEHKRIDTFEPKCWRRLLRVPWTARRSNQSILKEIYPEYSLEVLMLKLKLQYLGLLMQRIYPLWLRW